jgi:hypothetical protein
LCARFRWSWRYADDRLTGRNIAGHDGARAYNCVWPDRYAFQDAYASAYPDVVFDPYRFSSQRLVRKPKAWISPMVVVSNIAERPNETVDPYRDVFRRVEHAETIDVGTPTNDYSWTAISRTSTQQNHIVIDSNEVIDHDIPGISRNANPANPASLSNADPEKS